MSAQNSAGIQTLLDAEKEAQKIVQKAREYRTKRVKDAKSEAQKEIEDYRQQKEEEFKKYESEQKSGNKKAEQDAEKDAEKQLEAIKKAGDEKGSQVVDDLLKVVTTPQPEVPDKTDPDLIHGYETPPKDECQDEGKLYKFGETHLKFKPRFYAGPPESDESDVQAENMIREKDRKHRRTSHVHLQVAQVQSINLADFRGLT